MVDSFFVKFKRSSTPPQEGSFVEYGLSRRSKNEKKRYGKVLEGEKMEGPKGEGRDLGLRAEDSEKLIR